jgi:hypothetical protein
MQFIDGPTLQKKLDRTGQLPLKEILRIGLQIAEGLAAAHRQGLVHRDVKPANILLENGVERVKITDFGLARAGDDASLTQSGIVAGTPMYMSPEQADGLPVDFRSDLFSLGSVMYAMCTGRPPFRAHSSLATLKRVCEETPRPVAEINPDLPPWLGELLARLHAKAPADRFASAREVADLLAGRLAELQQGVTASAPRLAPSTKLPAETQDLASPRRPRRHKLMVAVVLLAVLAGLGLSEATGLTNVRGTVIRLFSPEGTLVVEVDDPAISVSLDGKELVITGGGVREIRLKPGQYEMKATKEGKLIRQELITVTKNGREVVRVSREPTPAQVRTADTAAWERSVAALPPEEQVKKVAARLKDLNPGFDGKVTHSIDGDVVSGLQFSTDQVTNIAPVRALAGLTSLNVAAERGKLADLSPLKGLRLTVLRCNNTKVADLSPLKGMPLTWLEFSATEVADLTPLKGMPLTHLFCAYCPNLLDITPLKELGLRALDLSGARVPDLSPLRGLSLKELDLFAATRVTDLSPLRGMPLETLNLGCTPVTDLSALKDVTTLRNLIVEDGAVRDLSPLKGLPLNRLDMRGTRVSDLTPLKGMPLRNITLDLPLGQNSEVLRSLKSLEQINNRPAREFWQAQEK